MTEGLSHACFLGACSQCSGLGCLHSCHPAKVRCAGCDKMVLRDSLPDHFKVCPEYSKPRYGRGRR